MTSSPWSFVQIRNSRYTASRKSFLSCGSIGLFCLILLVTQASNHFPRVALRQRSLSESELNINFFKESDEVYQRLLDLSTQTKIDAPKPTAGEQHTEKEIGGLKKNQIAPQSTKSPVESSTSILSNQAVIDESPNVYAFYTKRDWNLQEHDDTMIAAWKTSWKLAGYNPEVLTIENATHHPDFEFFIDGMSAILRTTSVSKPNELMPCYVRYLAMNVVGGGMMVDLDMTPKTSANASIAAITIPDTLTVYCNFDTPSRKEDWVKQVETQNGLPCAVVAAADEWLRVGKMMSSVAKKHRRQQIWSDAHALQFMTATGDVNLVKEEIAQSLRPVGWDRCHLRFV